MKKNNFWFDNLLFSICISGIFIALILLLNYVFDLFKVWNWSIQMFLVVYAIGIYKIKNIVVNLFFFFIVPLLLFLLENGAYVINGMQVFFEYFLAFYIFAFLYLSIYIAKVVKLKTNKKIYDYLVFTSSYIILLIVKFFMHSLASYFWWDTAFWPAMIYNGPWLATNCLTIIVVLIIEIPIFKLFEKSYLEQKNKWNN